MAVDPEVFKSVVGRFATGVTVVTAHAGGRHQALTANSFTSVSLEPALVLVCIQKSARFHRAILESGVWAVSVLGAHQEEVSRAFALHGRPWSADQFDPYPHAPGPVTGAILFTDALATLECRTYSTADAGDHTVVIGEVLGLSVLRPEGAPLLYLDGDYRSPLTGSSTPG